MYINHGYSRSRLYNLWAGMKARCDNPKRPKSHNYYFKGITYDPSWVEFPPFLEWATSNGYNDSLSLDRIDSTLNYTPSNCRWVNLTIQARNRKPAGGSSKFYGVSWMPSKEKWRAAIYINNTQKHIGVFKDELTAAMARDQYIIDNVLEGFNLNKDYFNL